MSYNINFCVISAAYLFITAVFYTRRIRVTSVRSVLFRAMLHCGIVSIALDIAAAVLDPYAYLWPAWSVYIVNILFLATAQLSGLLFFFYCLSLAGGISGLKTFKRAVALLPFAATAALLLLSPFTKSGIFFLDAGNVYRHGKTHVVLYASTAIYLFASFLVVFIKRRQLNRLKFFTIVAFLLATVTAMFIQLQNPYLLVNSSANAFSLTLIFYILEAPVSHVDALTGVLNRAALTPMLADIFEEGARCSIIAFSLDSLRIVNHTLGMKGGDEALAEFAGYLLKAFPKGEVLRAEGDVFALLIRGGEYIDRSRLTAISASTQTRFELTSGPTTLDASLFCVNSEDCENAAEMADIFENLLMRRRDGELNGVFLADAEFKARLKKCEAIEKATARALDEDRVEVYYQPIHDQTGRLCALEALVRVSDPDFGPLPTQDMVELAEKNGSILGLGERVLRKTCAFLRENKAVEWGLDHVGVNLSAVQCVQSDLATLVGGILKEYSMPEGLVAFEVTETAASALSTVKENMEKLSEKGVYFLLDDFGTGYANFRNLTALPYRCIKIDKSLLWNASESPTRMSLLTGIVRVVKELGLNCLCEGVETQEQARLLSSLGVSMLQGYYYSKPLSPAALLQYVEKAGARK